ncbi:hypothetical protein MKZ38_009363 [Zalerion maritima]|uniref:Uncharacterized protein n=1 Tax=Zalerion maritima TaxID=339359 RepID=A0AAD5WUR7_9PEZI|nr:hypothetical protein MKZ38_009363 [Zalerion maritima]
MSATVVPKLVIELTSTLSAIHETIAAVSSHESTLEELARLESQCETSLSTITHKFDQLAATLQSTRHQKREELIARRRREDEEIRLRREREDQEIREMESSEDGDLRDALEQEREEIEDKIENEIDTVEEEAQRRVEEGRARLAELEKKRQDINRLIDEQLKVPIPEIPSRRRSRNKRRLTKGTPVPASAVTSKVTSTTTTSHKPPAPTPAPAPRSSVSMELQTPPRRRTGVNPSPKAADLATPDNEAASERSFLASLRSRAAALAPNATGNTAGSRPGSPKGEPGNVTVSSPEPQPPVVASLSGTPEKKKERRNTAWWEQYNAALRLGNEEELEAYVEPKGLQAESEASTENNHPGEAEQPDSAFKQESEPNPRSEYGDATRETEQESVLQSPINISPGEPAKLVFENPTPKSAAAEPTPVSTPTDKAAVSDVPETPEIKVPAPITITPPPSEPSRTKSLSHHVSHGSDPFTYPMSRETPTGATPTSAGSNLTFPIPAASPSPTDGVAGPGNLTQNASPVSPIPELKITLPEVSANEAAAKLAEHAGEAPPQNTVVEDKQVDLDADDTTLGPEVSRTTEQDCQAQKGATDAGRAESRLPREGPYHEEADGKFWAVAGENSAQGEVVDSAEETSVEIPKLEPYVETPVVKKLSLLRTWNYEYPLIAQEPGSSRWMSIARRTKLDLSIQTTSPSSMPETVIEPSESGPGSPSFEQGEETKPSNIVMSHTYIQTPEIKALMEMVCWSGETDLSVQEPGTCRWTPGNDVKNVLVWEPTLIPETELDTLPIVKIKPFAETDAIREIKKLIVWDHELALQLQEPSSSCWIVASEHRHQFPWTPVAIELDTKTVPPPQKPDPYVQPEAGKSLMAMTTWADYPHLIMQDPCGGEWLPLLSHQSTAIPANIQPYVETESTKHLIGMRTWTTTMIPQLQEPGTGKWLASDCISNWISWTSKPLPIDLEDSPISPRVVKQYLEVVREFSGMRTWPRGHGQDKAIVQEPGTGKWKLPREVTESLPWTTEMEVSQTSPAINKHLDVTPESESYVRIPSSMGKAEKSTKDSSPVESQHQRDGNDSSVAIALASPISQPSSPMSSRIVSNPPSTQQSLVGSRPATPVPDMVDELAGLLAESSSNDEMQSIRSSSHSPVSLRDHSVGMEKSRFSTPSPSSLNKKRLTIEVPVVVCSTASSSSTPPFNEPRGRDGPLLSSIAPPEGGGGISGQKEEKTPNLDAERGLSSGQPQEQSSSTSPWRQDAYNRLNETHEDVYVGPEPSPFLFSDLSSAAPSLTHVPTTTEVFPTSDSFIPRDTALMPTSSHDIDTSAVADSYRFSNFHADFVTTEIGYPAVPVAMVSSPVDGRTSRASSRADFDESFGPDFPRGVEDEPSPEFKDSTTRPNDEDYDSSEVIDPPESDVDEQDLDPFADSPDSDGGQEEDPYDARMYEPPVPRMLETIPEVSSPVSAPSNSAPASPPFQLQSISDELNIHHSGGTPSPSEHVVQMDRNELGLQVSESDTRQSFRTASEGNTDHDEQDFVTPAESAGFLSPSGQVSMQMAYGQPSPGFEMMNAATAGDHVDLFDETDSDGDTSRHDDDDEDQMDGGIQLPTHDQSISTVRHRPESPDEMSSSPIQFPDEWPQVQPVTEIKEQAVNHRSESPDAPTTALRTPVTQIWKEDDIESTTPDDAPPSAPVLTPASKAVGDSEAVSTTPAGDPAREVVSTTSTTPQSTPPTRGLLHSRHNPNRPKTPPKQKSVRVAPEDDAATPKETPPRSPAPSSPPRPFSQIPRSLADDTKSPSYTPDGTPARGPLTCAEPPGRETPNNGEDESDEKIYDGEEVDPPHLVPRDVTNLSWRDRADSLPRSTRSASTISSASASTISGIPHEGEGWASEQLSMVRLRGDSNISASDMDLDASQHFEGSRGGKDIATPTAGTPVLSGDGVFAALKSRVAGSNRNFGPDTSSLKSNRSGELEGGSDPSNMGAMNQEKEVGSLEATRTFRNSVSSGGGSGGSLFMRMRSMFEAPGPQSPGLNSQGPQAGGSNRNDGPGSGSLVGSVRRLSVPSGIDLGGYVSHLGRGGTKEEKTGLLDGDEEREE